MTPEFEANDVYNAIIDLGYWKIKWNKIY
jgi:hypothetical protein